MTPTLLRIVCSLIALSLAACSNFDSRFVRESRVARMDDAYSGTYRGQWTSSSHPGNGGKLWCIFSKQRDSEYLAEFRATWHGIFSSEHSVALKAKRGPAGKDGAPVLMFAGTAAIRMFIGGGSYQCEGQTDGRRMQACYDATYDRGTFELLRVPPPQPPR